MKHLVVGTIVASLMAVSTSAVAEPRTAAGTDLSTRQAVIQTTHPTLQASLDRIWDGSKSWRTAVAAAGREGRRVLLLTPDQVVVRTDGGQDALSPFETGVIAEVAPVVGEGEAVGTVLVVINLPLLESVHTRRGSLPVELHDDLDTVVAHEIYGHALPYLLAGSLSGRCADPEPGQRASDACAIRRENVVRTELGLTRRTDAGLNGLMLAYRGRH